MAHTVIPLPRGTTFLELTHKRNINDKTIPERDREVRDFIGWFFPHLPAENSNLRVGHIECSTLSQVYVSGQKTLYPITVLEPSIAGG